MEGQGGDGIGCMQGTIPKLPPATRRGGGGIRILNNEVKMRNLKGVVLFIYLFIYFVVTLEFGEKFLFQLCIVGCFHALNYWAWDVLIFYVFVHFVLIAHIL